MTGRHAGGHRKNPVRRFFRATLELLSFLAFIGLLVSLLFTHRPAIIWLWTANILTGTLRMVEEPRRAVVYSEGSLCVAGALIIAATVDRSSHVLTVMSMCAAVVACVALAWALRDDARRLFSRSAKSESQPVDGGAHSA